MDLNRIRQTIKELDTEAEAIRQRIDEIAEEVAAIGSPVIDGMPAIRSGKSDPTASRAVILSERIRRHRERLQAIEAERSHIIRSVRAACHGFGHKQRTVVLLRIEGKPYRVIATRIGCSVRQTQRIFAICGKKLQNRQIRS